MHDQLWIMCLLIYYYLQCATVTVVIAGETRDLGFILQYGTVQILVGGKQLYALVRF